MDNIKRQEDSMHGLNFCVMCHGLDNYRQQRIMS
jgi:hypothetical protein